MRLCVVMPVPDHRVAAASRATDALWPAVLAHQGEALRVVEQGCEVDWVHCGHDDRNPSCSPTTVDRLKPSSYPNPPSRASVTPEADKSLFKNHCAEKFVSTCVNFSDIVRASQLNDSNIHQ